MDMSSEVNLVGASARAKKSRNRIRVCSLALGFVLVLRAGCGLFFDGDYLLASLRCVTGMVLPAATFTLMTPARRHRLSYVAIAALILGILFIIQCVYTIVVRFYFMIVFQSLILAFFDLFIAIPCFALALMVYMHQRALRLEEEDAQLPYTRTNTAASKNDEETTSLLQNNHAGS